MSDFFETLDSGTEDNSFDIWGMLWRRKWIIVASTLLGLVCGFLYFYRVTPQYRSTAQVLIERKQPAIPMLDGASSVSFDRYQTMADALKHPIVLRSPQIITMAYEAEKLSQCQSLQDSESPLGAIIDNLDVQPIETGLGVYLVSYTGTNPQDTQKIVTSVLAAYQEFLEVNHRNVGKETRRLITEARDELMRQLEGKEKLYAQFRADAPLMYEDGEGTNLHQQRQAAIETQRATLQLKINEYQAQLDTVVSAVESQHDLDGIVAMAMAAMPNITRPEPLVDRYAFQRELHTRQAEQSLVVRAQTTMMPLKLQEKELATRYGKDHPRVKSIQRSIAEAQRYLDDLAKVEQAFIEENEEALAADDPQYQEELDQWRSALIRAYVDSLRQQLAHAQQSYKTLETLFKDEEQAAKELAVYQAKDEGFRKDIERTQTLFEGVVRNLDQINLADNGNGYNFNVIAPAGSGQKVAPSAIKTFVLSFMLGGLCGAGIGYLIELSDKSFRSPLEISQQLQIPVVGHVPIIATNKDAVTEATRSLAPVLCTAHAPRTPSAEAYRTIRTALFFNARGEQHQVIQITSPRPGDGKSTLAANLAIAIAQAGKSTLLVDADFRRPTQHRLFGFTTTSGVARVVDGGAEPAEACFPIECIANLTVMGCGSRPENPSELLSSKQFQTTLAYLREQFDFVIVDTPPLLAVSDPRAVSVHVDGVLLTMRIDKEARPVALRAKEILLETGANIMGAVVNGVDAKDSNYYSYGSRAYGYNAHRYGYGYAYGYRDDYVEDESLTT